MLPHGVPDILLKMKLAHHIPVSCSFSYSPSQASPRPPWYSSRLSSDSGALVEPEPADVLLLLPSFAPSLYICVCRADWQRRHRVEIHRINRGLPPKCGSRCGVPFSDVPIKKGHENFGGMDGVDGQQTD